MNPIISPYFSMLSAIVDVKDFFRTRKSICKSEHEHSCALIGYYQ